VTRVARFVLLWIANIVLDVAQVIFSSVLSAFLVVLQRDITKIPALELVVLVIFPVMIALVLQTRTVILVTKIT
jgi:hypothetical protein